MDAGSGSGIAGSGGERTDGDGYDAMMNGLARWTRDTRRALRGRDAVAKLLRELCGYRRALVLSIGTTEPVWSSDGGRRERRTKIRDQLGPIVTGLSRVPGARVANPVTNGLKDRFVRSTRKVMAILRDRDIDGRECDVNAVVRVMCSMIRNQTRLLSLIGKGPPQTGCVNRLGNVRTARSNGENHSVVCADHGASAGRHCRKTAASCENAALMTGPRLSNISLDRCGKDDAIGQLETQLGRSLRPFASDGSTGRTSPPATYTPDIKYNGSLQSFNSGMITYEISPPTTYRSDRKNSDLQSFKSEMIMYEVSTPATYTPRQ